MAESKETDNDWRRADFRATTSKPPPLSNVGYFTFLRTYARALDPAKPHGPVETWTQMLERVVLSCNEQLKTGLSRKELERLFDHMYNLRCLVAGRFLWQLGTRTVDKLGLASLQNCAFVTVDHPVRAAVRTFDLLMLGAGVGFSVQRVHIDKLPPVHAATIKRTDVKDADFIVPDSREGWMRLLSKTLKSHFYGGGGFTYSCQLLRSKGAPIASFGGIASGPDVLEEGIGDISKILNARAGKKARPIDMLDIFNIIGHIVVSGNVRRSAQIALGDADDVEFLRAKRWDLGSIPNWRSNSNNSVVCDDIRQLADNEDFWAGYKGNGEPYGVINLKAMRAMGRTNETKYPDPSVAGCNPCAEQSLAPSETCCLGELFLPNIRTEAEFRDVVTLLYRVCKASLLLPCHIPETDAIVKKNLRMGLGVTGYLQATEEQKRWLAPTYEYLRAYDVEHSRKLGVPTSVKLTTVKPSGTLSLVASVTPGCHPAYSPCYIRRIRVNSSHPMVEELRKLGHHVEFVRGFSGTPDLRTVVVSFPCKVPPGTICAKDMTALQQMDIVDRLQTDWSDNAVSCTIYYRPHELPDIRRRLTERWDRIKSVSFLLHSEHGFAQAPYEEISEAEYQKMAIQCKPIAALPHNANVSETVATDEKSASQLSRPRMVRGASRLSDTSGASWNDGAAAHDAELMADSECDGGGCPIR